MPNDLLHQYEVLYRKAVADITMAQLAVAAQNAAIDDATILFHLQQAAEKLIKSLLAYSGIHFEKVHDLMLLVTKCNDNKIKLPLYASGFAHLNPFAVLGRYDIFVSDLTAVRDWIEKLVDFQGFVNECILRPGERNSND